MAVVNIHLRKLHSNLHIVNLCVSPLYKSSLQAKAEAFNLVTCYNVKQWSEISSVCQCKDTLLVERHAQRAFITQYSLISQW